MVGAVAAGLDGPWQPNPAFVGVVASYISSGRGKSGRTLTDAEVTDRFQFQDVARQLRAKGPDGLSEAAKEAMSRLGLSLDTPRVIEELYAYGPGGKGTLPRESLLYQASNQRRDPPQPPQGPITDGLTVRDITERLGTPDTETTARLLENAGWLESTTYGGHPRRLVPAYVIEKGDGDNIAVKKAGQRGRRAFPVFNPESVEGIVWTLEWDKITKGVKDEPNKKAKLAWLIDNYGFLPDKTMAELSGMSVSTVERRRAKSQNEGCRFT